MIITVILLVVILNGKSKANVIVKCSDNSTSKLTFEPSNDVDGRYIVKWCTESDREVTNWELTLRYNENKPEEKCQKYDLLFRGAVHSRFNRIVNTDLNCTNVCFSTSLDLIFNGTCYHIKTLLHHGQKSSSPSDYVFYIKNSFPKTQFTDSKALVHMQSNDKDLIAHWFLSYIPATEYKMELCTYNNMTEQEHCEDVTGSCRTAGARRSEVRCRRPAPYARYTMRLTHRAPWDAGRLFHALRTTEHRYEHSPERSARALASDVAAPWASWALWAAGGALAAALVVAAALAVLCRRARRRQLWLHWVSQAGAKGGGAAGRVGRGGRGRVLLLYARDCGPAMRLAAALRSLLRHAADHAVLDLYAADTWAQAARAPGEWLRRALALPDVRLVLLQTPALAALLPARPGPGPGQPLLGAAGAVGAGAGAPHAADALVALALRLLQETTHASLAYRKCYKAYVSGLEVDVAPTVTPLRRYRLPHDALALLRDLDPALFPPDAAPACPAAPTCPAAPAAPTGPAAPTSPTAPTCPTAPAQLAPDLRRLREAAEELAAFARDNPGYWTDDLNLCTE